MNPSATCVAASSSASVEQRLPASLMTICLVLAALLVGCGGGGDESATETVDSAVETAPAPQPAASHVPSVIVPRGRQP